MLCYIILIIYLTFENDKERSGKDKKADRTGTNATSTTAASKSSTGDTTNIPIWIVIMFAAIILAIALAPRRRKHNK